MNGFEYYSERERIMKTKTFNIVVVALLAACANTRDTRNGSRVNPTNSSGNTPMASTNSSNSGTSGSANNGTNNKSGTFSNNGTSNPSNNGMNNGTNNGMNNGMGSNGTNNGSNNGMNNGSGTYSGSGTNNGPTSSGTNNGSTGTGTGTNGSSYGSGTYSGNTGSTGSGSNNGSTGSGSNNGSTGSGATLEPKFTPGTPFVQGDVKITPIYHDAMLLEVNGKSIYVDPGLQGNYEGQPKADLVLFTSMPEETLDASSFDAIKSEKTVILAPKFVSDKYPGMVKAIKKGETWEGIKIEAVPIKNTDQSGSGSTGSGSSGSGSSGSGSSGSGSSGSTAGNTSQTGEAGNGYILTVNKQRIYISGEAECDAKTKTLKNIDIAVMSLGSSPTVQTSEVVTCLKALRPKVVIPYDEQSSNLEQIKTAMADEKDIKVQILKWY
jgi:L-ascorbate metabolism protein UlaG (beta-lactamase superfamily)